MAKPPKDPKQPNLPTDPMTDGGYSLPPSNPVVAFRLVGTSREIALSPEKRTFTVGSALEPEVDLHVSSKFVHGPTVKEHISRLHLLIQRRDNRLVVRDQGSTNGTHYKGRTEPSFEVAAGDAFRPGNVTLLAVDEHLRLLRPHLLWALGLEAHAAADAALEILASGDPLALVGPEGCDQLALAEQIHRASARRDRAFVALDAAPETRAEQTAILARAELGTVFLDLDRVPQWPAHLIKHLFTDDTLRARPIVATPDTETAAKLLGHPNANQLRPISVPALAERRGDLLRLLDGLFLRAGGKHQIIELAAYVEDVDALTAYAWPGNFAELRREAPRLHALIEHRGKVRAASRALGMSHSSLLQMLDRLGLVLLRRPSERPRGDD